MKTDILIIGGGPAGILAGMSAKHANPKINVILVKKEKNIDIRCSEPYVLGKQIKLKEMTHSDKMIKQAGIDLIIDEAVRIDTEKKSVYMKSKGRIEYKSLVIATGASPFVPPVAGVKLQNVFTLRCNKDTEKIQKALAKASDVIIIGCGAIGVEIASMIKNSKINVTIVEMMPHALSMSYDEEFSKKIEDVLKEKRINLLLNTKLVEICGRKNVQEVVVSPGKKLKADIVLIVTGVRSEIRLASESGIKTGKFGIYTKKTQETNCKEVYACGDCAQAICLVTGKPTPSQLATTAVFQGKVAGMNATISIGNWNVKKAEFPGVTNAAVSTFYGKAVGRTGLTQKQAKNEGIETISGTAKSFSRYAFHPGAKPLEIKIIFDKKTKTVIGAQIFGGKEGVSQRINLISLAIQKKMTAEDLAKLNHCAHPETTPLPFSEPIVMAAENALSKFLPKK